MDIDKDCCSNCKKYMLNGGKCTGVRSRHCKKYKKLVNDDKHIIIEPEKIINDIDESVPGLTNMQINKISDIIKRYKVE